MKAGSLPETLNGKSQVSRLDSTVDYENQDDGYIRGCYDSAKRLKATSQAEEKNDSQTYIQELQILASKAGDKNSDRQDSVSERDQQRMDAHKQPLSMSKRK